MKFFRCFLLLLFLSSNLTAAPLFPDVPDTHWGRDAVASLAAQGLLEGYPDGTFKGDRSASRWELAIQVARLLRKAEQGQATFATRSESEELQKLARAFAEELEALGVRVGQIEGDVERLDTRITELERITFYGSLEARYVGQTFKNDGASDNDSLRGGAGLPGGLPYLNYESLVGTARGGLLLHQVNGVLPVVDYLEGRLLSTGTGLTAKGTLGINVQVSDEIDAGLELVGYASQGDLFVDGYWGLNAPYSAHVGSGNVAAGGLQSLDHTPFTRMVLDKFWVRHKGSQIQLNVGSLNNLKMEPLVYQGQGNMSLDGPRRLNFGFQVEGKTAIGDDQNLDWEVFQSRIGSRNALLGNNYQHEIFGGDIAYNFHDEAGRVQLNFARYIDESNAGNLLLPGLIVNNNVAYGASPGWTPFQWVNPPGHFALQRSLSERNQTGQGLIGFSPADTRPIAGWNANADNAIGLNPRGGTYGPQSQNTYGLVAQYRWDLGDGNNVGLLAKYGHSDYRPNRNSSFESSADALRLTLDGAVLDGDLDWDFSYISVDPNYNPGRFRNGLVGARFPSVFNVVGAFHLHDSGNYPHNREGFRAGLKWSFDEKKGKLWARGEWLDQKRTSLYDVRVTQGALGQAIPTNDVIGYAPGFIDYVFAGYAHPNIYGANSANSFTNNLTPLEDNRGEARRWEIGGRYFWDKPQIGLEASYRRMDFERATNLSPGLGGSQNAVDVGTDYLHIEGFWKFDKSKRLTLGMDYVKVKGHHDPGGLYNAFAVRTNSTDFINLDSTQTSPYARLDWAVNDKTEWNVSVRRIDTNDGTPASVTAGRAFDTIGSSAHPFEWSGWQVMSGFSLKF